MIRQLCGAKLEHILPITEEDRARSFHASGLFAATTPADGVVDLTDAHVWGPPQGSEDCVEYSICKQVDDLAVLQGQPLPDRPAPSLLYARTQIRQGLVTPGVGLNNEGSACGWALAELVERGTCRESEYPDTGENGTRVPPLSAWEIAPFVKIDGAHRILFEDGSDPETELMTGLAVAFAAAKAGKASPPSICMTVDDAYGALAPWQVYGADVMPGGKVWGGHCQVAPLFDPVNKVLGLASSWDDPAQRRVFRVSIPWLAKNGGGCFVVNGIVRLFA